MAVFLIRRDERSGIQGDPLTHYVISSPPEDIRCFNKVIYFYQPFKHCWLGNLKTGEYSVVVAVADNDETKLAVICLI